MGKFASRAELAGKIAWEGGITEAVDYGIKADDMPEGDGELEQAWLELEQAHEEYERATFAVERLLPDEHEWPADSE